MNKSLLFFLFSITFLSCDLTQLSETPLNAITDRSKFTREAALDKLKLVEPIQEEAIIGNWEIILSLFTVTSQNGEQGNSTFGLEGNRAEILAENKFIAHFPDGNRKGSWSLTEENTVFNELFDGEVFESYQVRVQGDTMEWLIPSGNEIMYFVLVKK